MNLSVLIWRRIRSSCSNCKCITKKIYGVNACFIQLHMARLLRRRIQKTKETDMERRRVKHGYDMCVWSRFMIGHPEGTADRRRMLSVGPPPAVDGHLTCVSPNINLKPAHLLWESPDGWIYTQLPLYSPWMQTWAGMCPVGHMNTSDSS